MEMSLLTHDHPLAGDTKMEDSGGTEPGGEDEAKMSNTMEQRTMQWPGDHKTDGQTERQAGQKVKGDGMSVRSDSSLREASSWTESERQLKAEQGKRGVGEEKEELKGEEMGKREEAEENHLPGKAALVFSPSVTVLPCPLSSRDTEEVWESERSPFLSPHGDNYSQHGYQYEFAEDTPRARCDCGCPDRDALKMGVSLMTSALFFPFLVWGGFVFLPFDAPLLDSAPLRLVYTLRCSVFAAAPIILGWLVLGVSRLRSGATQPFYSDDVKEAELQEVGVHRRFVSDSASLFLIYFLQLVVLAMYLSQEQLKIIPLLTIIFAFGRLAYWVAAAFNSSIRAFGFGLSFLPSTVMMIANFYFIFTVEAAGSIFSISPPPEEVPTPPPNRQRFWG